LIFIYFLINLKEGNIDMEKKYLMLLPLALPLFFGGKAAVTALRKKKKASAKGNGDTAEDTVILGSESSTEDIMENEAHINRLRSATGLPDIQEEVHPQGAETVNMDAEIPDPEDLPGEKENTPQGAKNNISTMDYNLEEKTIFTGPKGGKYYLNDKGKKIYLK
jgi:hypothetical protein